MYPGYEPWRRSCRAIALLALLYGGAAQAQEVRLSPANLWTFRELSFPEWSPDGRRIAFTVTRPEHNASDIYVADLEGVVRRLRNLANPGDTASTSRALLPEPWTPDGRLLLFTERGNIGAVDVETGQSHVLVQFGRTSPGYRPQEYYNGPDPVLSPDGTRLAFIRESELWVLDMKQGSVRQLTSSHAEGWHNLQPRWSPDGTRILYTAQATDEQRKFPTSDFAGTVIEVGFVLIGFGKVRLGVISAEGGETTWLGPSQGERYSLRGGSQAFWSPDGSKIVINRISLDHTARDILLADPATREIRELWREEVERWISPLAILVRWSPDSRRLLFTSERDGWNHVYLLDISGGAPRQLTSGAFTVTSIQVYDRAEVTPDWFADGRTIFFPSNEAGTPERHLYAVPVEGGVWRRVTPLAGLNVGSTLSPDGSHVAYMHSNPTTLPELYVQRTEGGQPRQITHLAVPQWLAGYRWREPRIVTFRNEQDAAVVTGRLFAPRSFTPSAKYPAVVFVHGAGYAQSVFRGWMRVDQTSFNHYLSDNGYVVLDIDFRGSAGYGAKFRTDVFDRLGEIDLDDVLAGVNYLRSLGYVDTSRVGIWGHSYGGFMVASALFRSPKTFAVGVSSAPVTDWERFFYLAPGYNEEHFGFPWENAAGTRRGSPLMYARALERPLLILSGVQDRMHLDAAALVNELVQHRKPAFDWVFYPDEPHGIRDPETREDYFRRIATYLDRHLKNEAEAHSR